MTHVTKSKFARGGGSHNIYLLTPTGRRAVDIRLVKIVYQCIHCLGKLKTHNAGVQCELNDNHYGFIHRDEAKELTQEERFMKIGKMFPSDYLRGLDVDKPFVVTIKSVTAEKARDQDGKMVDEFVMRFEELDKKLRLNLTMAKATALALGDEEGDTDNWIGKRVTVYQDKVKSFGKEHIVPRIREVRRDDVDLSKAIKSAQPGKPKSAVPNGNSAKLQQQPVKQGESSPVDTFFTQVQKATDDYYKGKEHLYNTLKRWPKFGDPDDVEAALSEAVDHANERRHQETEAEPVTEDSIPF